MLVNWGGKAIYDRGIKWVEPTWRKHCFEGQLARRIPSPHCFDHCWNYMRSTWALRSAQETWKSYRWLEPTWVMASWTILRTWCLVELLIATKKETRGCGLSWLFWCGRKKKEKVEWRVRVGKPTNDSSYRSSSFDECQKQTKLWMVTIDLGEGAPFYILYLILSQTSPFDKRYTISLARIKYAQGSRVNPKKGSLLSWLPSDLLPETDLIWGPALNCPWGNFKP